MVEEEYNIDTKNWIESHGLKISEQSLSEAFDFLNLPTEGKTPEETKELLRQRAQGYVRIYGEDVIPYLIEELRNVLPPPKVSE